MMEIFYNLHCLIMAAISHMAVEHLKCGMCNQETGFYMWLAAPRLAAEQSCNVWSWQHIRRSPFRRFNKSEEGTRHRCFLQSFSVDSMVQQIFRASVQRYPPHSIPAFAYILKAKLI